MTWTGFAQSPTPPTSNIFRGSGASRRRWSPILRALIAAGYVVVAEDRDGINGYMIGWPEADAYFIDNIAVDPAHQGQGLGRYLIEYAAFEARRLRLPAVRLYTNVAMTENLAMYAHIGFVETHRATEHGFERAYLRWSLDDQRHKA